MKTSFFDIENWREIGATLARNKTRTFLTAFGIFWGTAMLAMLMGGASGARGMMERNFAGFATNTGVVFPGERGISYKGFNKGSSWQLNTIDVENIRTVAPAIEHSTEVVFSQAKVAYGDKSKSATAIGVEPDYTKVLTPIIYEGRFLNAADVAASRKVVVIGKNVAAELFGNESPVGKYVSLNGIYFLCIGTIGQTSDASIVGRAEDSAIIPSSTLRRAFNLGNKVDFFLFTSSADHTPSDNKATIRRVLSSAHSFHPDDERAMDFMDFSEMFLMVSYMFMGLNILALFVGVGSLMAGVIGVGNIMWIIVKERTHEFGVRRAIGAKPADITVQVLSESIVLTLIAGIAGVCFAALVLGVADYVTADPMLGHAGFELPFGTALGIVATFFVLGSAAGTLPAIRAMRIKPIEAIRDK